MIQFVRLQAAATAPPCMVLRIGDHKWIIWHRPFSKKWGTTTSHFHCLQRLKLFHTSSVPQGVNQFVISVMMVISQLSLGLLCSSATGRKFKFDRDPWQAQKSACTASWSSKGFQHGFSGLPEQSKQKALLSVFNLSASLEMVSPYKEDEHTD